MNAPDVPIEHNPHCLGCGSRNPSSLGFTVDHVEPGRLRARVAFTQAHEGGVGRVHGGAVATALDEVIGRLGHYEVEGRDCVTAEMQVRYLLPTVTGAECTAEAVLTRREGRKLWITAELRAGDAVQATATGLMIELRSAA
ncbi:hypothetical protein DSM112329_01003 [Paraconexibacter sp. AEG42_29]|uniref:Acyl-coenzyme A thioesterase THEM4 n=1 Tax=Paraconexibacter sp. AEG42_29 TaxID=2997339 RepID=A0AAU7ARD6_9ACTN